MCADNLDPGLRRGDELGEDSVSVIPAKAGIQGGGKHTHIENFK
jgi:hypothetical protein